MKMKYLQNSTEFVQTRCGPPTPTDPRVVAWGYYYRVHQDFASDDYSSFNNSPHGFKGQQ